MNITRIYYIKDLQNNQYNLYLKYEDIDIFKFSLIEKKGSDQWIHLQECGSYIISSIFNKLNNYIYFDIKFYKLNFQIISLGYKSIISHIRINHEKKLKNSLLGCNCNKLSQYYLGDLIFIELTNENILLEKIKYGNNKLHKNENNKIKQEFNLELKKIKNENKILNIKIRELEIQLHYLKLEQPDKKINYNYEEIKDKNKNLNNEFKRVYRLISKNIGFNLLN